MEHKLDFYMNLLTVECRKWAVQFFSFYLCVSMSLLGFTKEDFTSSEDQAINVEVSHLEFNKQQELLRTWLTSKSVIHFSLDKRDSLEKKYIIIETKDLIKLYRARNFLPIWLDQNLQKNKIVKIAQKYMEDSISRHGLNSIDYLTYELKSLTSLPNTTQNWMYFELLMSEAFLRMGKDLANGRLNYSLLEKEFGFRKSPFKLFEYVQSAMNSNSENDFNQAMDKLAPQTEIYKKLQLALVKLNELKLASEWMNDINLDADLKFGSKNPAILRIRQRLYDLGYEVELGSSEFDDKFAIAVKDFQSLNSLMVDNTINKNGSFLKTINKKLSNRIEQVQMNLERQRFLPRKMESRYAFINTAFSEFKLIENGIPIMQFKTVVGKPTRRTPSKRDVIEEVILNPTWTIPNSIFKRDKLSKFQSDVEYLKAHHISVIDKKAVQYDPLDIDWNDVTAENFPYQLVQQPGLSNSLGVVKFPLHNHADNIYLHDTNEKNFFRSEVYNRHKSSGCVRLEKPLEFAEYLLKTSSDAGWNLNTIRSTVPPVLKDDELVTHTIKLNSAMPVYLMYMTVDFGSHGQIRFAEDIYGQDSRFAKILNPPLLVPDEFKNTINIMNTVGTAANIPGITGVLIGTGTLSNLVRISSFGVMSSAGTANVSGGPTIDVNALMVPTMLNREVVQGSLAGVQGDQSVQSDQGVQAKKASGTFKLNKLGILKISGTAGPSQIFAFVKAIPCREVKGKVLEASCKTDKAISIPLNTDFKLPIGTYILGFENSIYPGFVRVSKKTSNIKLEKIQLNNFENNRNSYTYRVARDFTGVLEKSKNSFQTYFARQPIFNLSQYEFGGLYLKGNFQKDVSTRLNYRVCDSVLKVRALSEEARELCVNAKVKNIIPNADFFISNKTDGTFTEKWISEDLMDVVEVKQPYFLVAAPLKFGEFVSVFPGSYRIIDEEGKTVQKTSTEINKISVEYKTLFSNFKEKVNNVTTDKIEDLNI